MNCYIASVLAEVSLSSVLSVSLQELNPTYTASTVVDFLLENEQVPNMYKLRIDDSRDESPKWPHRRIGVQDFLIDSPWPRPPTSDWPAADSQATPTLPLQCDVAPLALQRRRRTPVRRPPAC